MARTRTKKTRNKKNIKSRKTKKMIGGGHRAPLYPSAHTGPARAPMHPGAPYGYPSAPMNTGAPYGYSGAPGYPVDPGAYGAPMHTGALYGYPSAPMHTSLPSTPSGAAAAAIDYKSPVVNENYNTDIGKLGISLRSARSSVANKLKTKKKYQHIDNKHALTIAHSLVKNDIKKSIELFNNVKEHENFKNIIKDKHRIVLVDEANLLKGYVTNHIVLEKLKTILIDCKIPEEDTTAFILIKHEVKEPNTFERILIKDNKYIYTIYAGCIEGNPCEADDFLLILLYLHIYKLYQNDNPNKVYIMSADNYNWYTPETAPAPAAAAAAALAAPTAAAAAAAAKPPHKTAKFVVGASTDSVDESLFDAVAVTAPLKRATINDNNELALDVTSEAVRSLINKIHIPPQPHKTSNEAKEDKEKQ